MCFFVSAYACLYYLCPGSGPLYYFFELFGPDFLAPFTIHSAPFTIGPSEDVKRYARCRSVNAFDAMRLPFDNFYALFTFLSLPETKCSERRAERFCCVCRAAHDQFTVGVVH